MKVKKSSITNSIIGIFCDYCNKPLTTKHNSEFGHDTDIFKFFGPPTIKCPNCRIMNKTGLIPYSQLNSVDRIRFWSNTIFFPTIIWFVAAPSFVIAAIGHLLFDTAPSLSIIKLIVPVGIIIGVTYITRKNLKIIEEIEKEHSDYSQSANNL